MFWDVKNYMKFIFQVQWTKFSWNTGPALCWTVATFHYNSRAELQRQRLTHNASKVYHGPSQKRCANSWCVSVSTWEKKTAVARVARLLSDTLCGPGPHVSHVCSQTPRVAYRQGCPLAWQLHVCHRLWHRPPARCARWAVASNTSTTSWDRKDLAVLSHRIRNLLRAGATMGHCSRFTWKEVDKSAAYPCHWESPCNPHTAGWDAARCWKYRGKACPPNLLCLLSSRQTIDGDNIFNYFNILKFKIFNQSREYFDLKWKSGMIAKLTKTTGSDWYQPGQTPWCCTWPPRHDTLPARSLIYLPFSGPAAPSLPHGGLTGLSLNSLTCPLLREKNIPPSYFWGDRNVLYIGRWSHKCTHLPEFTEL